MKLLLTSSGNTNKSIENALLALLGKPFPESSLVFIPTAANVDDTSSGWLDEDINNFRKLGFKNFDVVDIENVPEEISLPKFKKADVLVFGGGNCEYLLKQMRKVGLDKLLPEFIKTKVYVGISAGSMAAAKTASFSSAGILYYENQEKFNDEKGLGFVDFEIRPHLNSEFFPKVRIEFLEKLAKDTPSTFYAIDDNTAVKVVGGKIEVVTEGEWRKFN